MMTVDEFETEIESRRLGLTIAKPTEQLLEDSQKVYQQALQAAIVDGRPPVRLSWEKIYELGLWNDVKQSQAEKLQKQIAAEEIRLKSESNSIEVRREAALLLRRLRGELHTLLGPVSPRHQKTAQAIAVQARLDFLVARCLIVRETGKPYYLSTEEYSRSRDGVALRAAYVVGDMLYGIGEPLEESFLRRNAA